MTDVNCPVWFPLIPGTKNPAVKWGTESNLRTDAPPADTAYGFPTGARNGVFVVDLDEKNGKSGTAELSRLEALHGDLPTTRTVRTPSGGVHLYFAWDDAHPVRNKQAIRPGIDVRGEGGFVAAGGPYEVAFEGTPAVAPEWLMNLVAPAVAPATGTDGAAVAIDPSHPDWEYRISSAQAFLEAAPPCISGQGGDKQLWAISLRLSRTYELPVEVSVGLIQATYNPRCIPPWSDAELRHNLGRAGEIGHGPTGMFSVAASLLAARPPPGSAKSPAVAGMPLLADANADIRRRARHVDGQPYEWDLATSVSGGASKSYPSGCKELAAIFTGPGAAPSWCGVWQWDEFRRRLMAIDPPMRLEAETIGMSERDLMSVQLWLAWTGIKANLEGIKAAITVASSCCVFHPIRDYLDGLPEMSREAAEEYFAGFAGRTWGAPEDRDAEESASVMRWAIAAVRRIRVPGTEVQTMLVLAGDQGYRKSLLLKKLFSPDYFRDQIPALARGDLKEASIALEGYWGIEIAEGAAFVGAHESIKKEFISRAEDKYRPVWAAGTLVVPRQCVFALTTNEDDFLDDATGETRYDVCEVRAPIDLDLVDRDAFWSAARALDLLGVAHYRDRAVVGGSAEGKREAGRHSKEDPWTDVVRRYAESTAPKFDGWVRASDCLTYGVPIEIARQRPIEMTRVRAILRRAYGPSKVHHFDDMGRSTRGYFVG